MSKKVKIRDVDGNPQEIPIPEGCNVKLVGFTEKGDQFYNVNAARWLEIQDTDDIGLPVSNFRVVVTKPKEKVDGIPD